MDTLRQWWSNEQSRWVKFVFLVLMANGLPAFLILMALPHMTEILFVWTIEPTINARLVGVMYSNALLLIAFGLFQPSWPRVRVIMVVITLFSIFATILTFFFLKPFLAHPWFHLAYWLTMYLVLFFAAPYVFITHERKHGGRLPRQAPLAPFATILAALSLAASLLTGLGLIFRLDTVARFWPWQLPPLVAGLIGVLFLTHAAAYAWAIWDGDWLRVRPIFWQAPITGLLFILLPLLHASQLRPDAAMALTLYYTLAGLLALAHLALILVHRPAERSIPAHAD